MLRETLRTVKGKFFNSQQEVEKELLKQGVLTLYSFENLPNSTEHRVNVSVKITFYTEKESIDTTSCGAGESIQEACLGAINMFYMLNFHIHTSSNKNHTINSTSENTNIIAEDLANKVADTKQSIQQNTVQDTEQVTVQDVKQDNQQNNQQDNQQEIVQTTTSKKITKIKEVEEKPLEVWQKKKIHILAKSLVPDGSKTHLLVSSALTRDITSVNELKQSEFDKVVEQLISLGAVDKYNIGAETETKIELLKSKSA